MRLLLSADWQIGMRFRQFGAQAAGLQEARLRTLERVLKLAEERAVDGFVIAGDLFEDHQIEAALVARVYELFARHSAVPIFIVPGNHDPIGSPGAIWARAPFHQPPPHVRVFAEAAAVEVGGGWLLASPLTQKRSSIDPSLKLAELAQTLPPGARKVGVTHGSLAIPSMHEPDDFPIAPDAATRAGLDFLAVGHWHSSLTLDGGRLLMTGTPEPTSFEESDSGYVHLFDGDKCEAIRCAELCWVDLACEPAQVAGKLPPAERTVLRVTLTGFAQPGIELDLSSFTAAVVRDETVPAFTESELAELRQNHPLLAEVFADLDALPERAELESAVGGVLDEPVLRHARQLLLRELRTTEAPC